MMDAAGNEIVISPNHPAWNKPTNNWQDFQIDPRFSLTGPAPSVETTPNQDAGMFEETRRGNRQLMKAEKRQKRFDEKSMKRGLRQGFTMEEMGYNQFGGPIYMDGGMHHNMYMSGGGYPPMYQPVELSDAEIAQILAAGGSIKYL